MDEDQRSEIPNLTQKVIAGAGSVAKAVAALEGDDSPDARAFIAAWTSVSKSDRQRLVLEDFVAASGLSARRFIEVLTGALMQQCQDVSKMMLAVAQPKVLKSLVKAATDEVPIVAFNATLGVNQVVGHTNGDTKAMELFGKATGLLPMPKGSVTNINLGKSKDEDDEPEEIQELQSMDEFLMEMQDVVRPHALPAPSVDFPTIVPEVEYMDADV